MTHRSTGRGRPVLLAAALLGGLLVPAATDQAEAAAGCGRYDMPETGIAGDVPIIDQISGRADKGYNCGLALVGFNGLGGRGDNANMAWSGHCAYIAGDGVAVVDVSDPAHPQHVKDLHGAGANATIETLHAMTTGDTAILATGRYGLFGLSGGSGAAPVDLWDVRDCANPVHLSTVWFPSNVHNLTINADATRLYSTLPLQAADISDPSRPFYLGDIEADLFAQGNRNYYFGHEAWPSPDGRRLYIGGQVVGMEHLYVVNIEGWPQEPAKVISSIDAPGHSIRPASVDGRQYLVNSDESIVNLTAKGCVPDALTPFGGVSRPFITDITDETNPIPVAEVRIPIGEPVHCVEQILSNVNPSVHYQDLDDPDDTTFLMTSSWNSGLRVVDVRDPLRPREVAYFNPGRVYDPNRFSSAGVGLVLGLAPPNHLDQAWAHSRYVPETGHIWLTTSSGGFWVLELEPQLRHQLGLPERPAAYPNGRPPRPAETVFDVGSTTFQASMAASYCTLEGVIYR